MVKDGLTRGDVLTPRDAERAMVLSHARGHGGRAGLAALLALDDTLANVLRTTREPMVGQMRLTWWHDAIASLSDHAPPAEPVLAALARDVAPQVPPAEIARLVEGWEELLEPTLDDAALDRFAAARGSGLFRAAGRLLSAGAGDPLDIAGRGWALADLAAHVADRAEGGRIARLAAPLLDEATAPRWSRNGRPLGTMAHLARLAGAGQPRRTARALWHGLTGM